MLEFTLFVARYVRKEDCLGDFARDWVLDRNRVEPANRDQLQSYLRKCGACIDACDAAETLWTRYERACK